MRRVAIFVSQYNGNEFKKLQKIKIMQNFKVITAPNTNVKIEIEGVGTIMQIELADKLYDANVIDWKCRCKCTTIRLTDNLIDIAINKLNLYPRWF